MTPPATTESDTAPMTTTTKRTTTKTPTYPVTRGDGRTVQVTVPENEPRQDGSSWLRRLPKATPTHRAEYDAAQTEKCDRLRALLQSIAVLAVQAQDMDPSGDPLADQLDTIASDLRRAVDINAALNRDDVHAEVR